MGGGPEANGGHGAKRARDQTDDAATQRGGPGHAGSRVARGRPAPPAAPAGAEPASGAVRRIALPVRASSCAVARHFVRSALIGARWPGDVEAAVLLASELVANAMAHAHSPCHLSVQVDGARVHIEASDADPEPPVIEHPPADSPRGRGLVLVDALSSAWGSRVEPEEGKTIWFELSVQAGRGSRQGESPAGDN